MCVGAGRQARRDREERRGGGEERKVNAPGRSLQVSLVRSRGARGCLQPHGFPRPPHPSAQPCSSSYGRRGATPRLVPPRGLRALLPRAAQPRRAGLPLCPRRLLPAAMTAPRAARRGVRVRERAERWGERGARAEAAARPAWGTCGRARGPRARAPGTRLPGGGGRALLR